jgi:hypothetical protein
MEPAATYRTANFVVHAPTHRVARLVGEAAEQHRKAQALSWLGRELPLWPEPCPITVALTDAGTGGATSFAFDGGAVREQHMHLEGSLERLLADALPHEVTHTVFAHHFRTPLPRWADEGGALLSEDEEEQQRHEKLLRQILDTPGRAIPLRRLFGMKDFPGDVMALYAEGYSVARFLVERKDRPTFLAFVRQGMKDDWDGALREHYGFDKVEELERVWLARAQRDRGASGSSDAPPTLRGRSGFPGSPPPRMAFAVMTGNGTLIVRMPTTTYVPVTSYVEQDGKEVPRTTYQVETKEGLRRFAPEEVRAFGTDGKRLERKTLLARLSKEEVPVLVSSDGREVDPFHLQLIKEGTVILVLPVESLELPPRPAPAGLTAAGRRARGRRPRGNVGHRPLHGRGDEHWGVVDAGAAAVGAAAAGAVDLVAVLLVVVDPVDVVEVSVVGLEGAVVVVPELLQPLLLRGRGLGTVGEDIPPRLVTTVAESAPSGPHLAGAQGQAEHDTKDDRESLHRPSLQAIERRSAPPRRRCPQRPRAPIRPSSIRRCKPRHGRGRTTVPRLPAGRISQDSRQAAVFNTAIGDSQTARGGPDAVSVTPRELRRHPPGGMGGPPFRSAGAAPA